MWCAHPASQGPCTAWIRVPAVGARTLHRWLAIRSDAPVWAPRWWPLWGCRSGARAHSSSTSKVSLQFEVLLMDVRSLPVQLDFFFFFGCFPLPFLSSFSFLILPFTPFSPFHLGQHYFRLALSLFSFHSSFFSFSVSSFPLCCPNSLFLFSCLLSTFLHFVCLILVSKSHQSTRISNFCFNMGLDFKLQIILISE